MKFKDLIVGDMFVTKCNIDIEDVILYTKISTEGYIRDKHNALAVLNKQYRKGFMELEDEVYKCT